MTSIIWNDKYNEDYTGEVTVSPSSGNGNAQVSISGSPNEGLDRSGTITASGSGINREISVVNEGRRHVFMTGDGLSFRTSDGSTYNTIKKTDIGVKGVIGLYSTKGLDNKRMAANPLWRDESGLENHLQMKNFLWKLGSGCGSYITAFTTWGANSNVTIIQRNDSRIEFSAPSTSGIYISTKSLPLWTDIFRVKVSNVEGKLGFRYLLDRVYTIVKFTETDTIFEIKRSEIPSEATDISFFLLAGGSVTIEQIPDYSGAIVFDGVDDYGICETFPILTKEKGYTVMALRKWLSEKDGQCLVSNRLKTLENNVFNFELRNIDQTLTRSFSDHNTDKVNYPTGLVSWQTSTSYNGTINLNSNYYKGNNCLNVCAMDRRSLFANAAIYSLVIIDHDTTEEERQLVIDYWKKEFPWLFPDQAWTVTGKTNEDSDRATIANLTGNGNDLVLSNFLFAGNSGYGLYAQDFSNVKWKIATPSRVEATKTNSSFNITEVKSDSIQLYYLSNQEEVAFTVPSIKVRITGLTDGQAINYKYSIDGTVNNFLISSDGIYDLPEFEFPAKGDYYGFNLTKIQSSCNITIEQIPDYEGYLVTDGVDDKLDSNSFSLGKNWTVVGDWKFIVKENKNSGAARINKFYFCNRTTGIRFYINSTTTSTLLEINKVLAVSSDGSVYDENWNVHKIDTGNIETNSGKIQIGCNGPNFTQVAFKKPRNLQQSYPKQRPMHTSL